MQNNRPLIRNSRRRLGGFTLIELMIAVAIIGILVRLAYPAYTQSVLKSRRTEAKAALLDLASREERYFSTANQYTNSASSLGYAAGATLTPAAPLPVLTGNVAYYNLSVVTSAAGTVPPTFAATATAVGAQVNDTKCVNFTLNQAGVQGVSGTSSAMPGDCW